MPARFGEMLLNRRRQMGLSIQQVANTIKIRPQIIEYFENEDFSSMPPRGYAQGMISSYARFLGLNPRTVVDAYFSALSVYERESGRGAGRYQEAAGQVSPHGTYADGRYLMLDRALPSSRYAQRPPQAGYVSESTSMHEPVSASNLRGGDYERGRRLGAGPSQRGSGSRSPYQGGRSSDPSMTNSLSASGRGAAGRGYAGRQGTAPRGSSSRGAAGYRAVPGAAGQGRGRVGGSSRQRSAAGGSAGSLGRSGYGAQRPQGRPRQNAPMHQVPGGRGQARPGVSQRGRSARGPQQLSPLQDPRLIMGGLGTVALLLVIVIVLLISRGCSAGASTADKQSSTQTQVAAGSNGSSSAASNSANGSASDATSTSSQDQGQTTANQTQGQQAENAQPVVKVSLPSGKTSWIEVKLDGTIVYSDSVTGPFEQEYKVTKSIEVSVTKPADVTVTKDGEKVRYDTKSSGVGKVTIAAPQQTTDAASDGESGQGAQGSESASQQSGADSNGTASQASGTAAASQASSSGSSAQTQATG